MGALRRRTVALGNCLTQGKGSPALRSLRSVLLVVGLTVAAFHFNRNGFHPPHGHPVAFALAASWLVAVGIAMLTGILGLHPRAISLAKWERDGRIYDSLGVGGFRWILVHSPLGWINGNLHLDGNGPDLERLLRDIDTAEWVHWLMLVSMSVLAVSYLAGGYHAHGIALLLVRIPFDLYPIMLQRRNRGRVRRVMVRVGERS